MITRTEKNGKINIKTWKYQMHKDVAGNWNREVHLQNSFITCHLMIACGCKNGLDSQAQLLVWDPDVSQLKQSRSTDKWRDKKMSSKRTCLQRKKNHSWFGCLFGLKWRWVSSEQSTYAFTSAQPRRASSDGGVSQGL